MISFKEHVEAEKQKHLISQIIKSTFPSEDEKDLEDLTELVYEKINSLNEMRMTIKEKELSSLEEAAEKAETTVDKILDSLVYFTIIAECVWLEKKLSEYI